jgi:hypothetical protein
MMKVLNVWQTEIGTTVYTVVAGAEGGTSSGLIAVQMNSPSNNGFHLYAAPNGSSGPLTILGIKGPVVTLGSGGGGNLTFDLTTGAWQ